MFIYRSFIFLKMKLLRNIILNNWLLLLLLTKWAPNCAFRTQLNGFLGVSLEPIKWPFDYVPPKEKKPFICLFIFIIKWPPNCVLPSSQYIYILLLLFSQVNGHLILSLLKEIFFPLVFYVINFHKTFFFPCSSLLSCFNIFCFYFSSD
jgi:hypothetical protein